MEISAVIRTRNRAKSLHRLLTSLSVQNQKPHEVIIVDSSDVSLSVPELRMHYPTLNIIYSTSEPSSCLQHNKGIQLATASHVLLCDDDLEIPADYLAFLGDFLTAHPHVGALSGLLVELNGDGGRHDTFRTIRLAELLWRFVFQLTVWSDLNKIQTSSLARPAFALLERFYRRRGNTFTMAGWPLVTQIDSPFFRTSFFTLGGAVVRRDWLLRSPYDEVLDPNGIGDHYGVALKFPGQQSIVVLTQATVIHHKAGENRLSPEVTYFRRILALDYFMAVSPDFSAFNRFFFVWSLLGNLIVHSIRGRTEMRKATSRALMLIMRGHNPYVLASKSGEKCVSPSV
ncbi:MAG: glycosyltransferase family 2 protein [Ignavibacteriales bacterium]|nr:glycosyltransferase family 2 protein [Ignavibacteriales bacterium]